MKKGIAVAGNMIVDTIYSITRYPDPGELAIIENNVTKATGGAACNVIIDLARLDPGLPLTALGVVGDDENGSFILQTLSGYKNIDLTQVQRLKTTSFTMVMSDLSSKQRTFFHFKGANAEFSEPHIRWDLLNAELLHIGYLMLLDELDKPDHEYGTRMARLLASAKQQGIRTSIDLVSDEPCRFKSVVPPALKYTDYCIINEIEAERTAGIPLRGRTGLMEENIPAALNAIRDMGVSRWVVVHAPEGGYGLDCTTGQIVSVSSLKLPESYIRGTNGAGDAYCAGVLYGAWKGETLREAMELGTACAACSLSEPGATEGMRTHPEVMRVYRSLRRQDAT